LPSAFSLVSTTGGVFGSTTAQGPETAVSFERDAQHGPEGKTTSRCKHGDTRVNQKLACKWRCKAKAEIVASHGPPVPEAGVDLAHVSDSESEVDTSLLSSTASPRLGDPNNMKRTRGTTLDFVALHRGPSKKTRPWE
jgi:hypothetical protein